MRTYCAVRTCKNQGKHLIPQDPTIRRQWIRALRLDVDKTHKQLRKCIYICSDHFKPSDFCTTSQLFEGAQAIKRLKKKAIPSIFPWTAEQSQTLPSTHQEDISLMRCSSELHRKTYNRTQLPLAFAEEIPFMSSDPNIEEDPLQLDNNKEYGIEEYYADIEVQDHNPQLYEGTEQSNEYDSTSNNKKFTEAAVQTCVCETPLFSSQMYRDSKKVIHFYTGLESYEKCNLVFDSLGESVTKLKFIYGPPPQKIQPFEQFFMTMILLRRHYTFEDIAMKYIISIKQVSNIFITWVRFMSLQWRKLDLWLDKEKVQAYMPLDFHDKYPNTRIIIDATECPIQKPGLPLAQQISFSTYKNKNTIKALIGIAPSGLITYVSPCYGGSASDRQIIERSAILQKFDYNDEVMVDKGLNVQDIFISYGVKVNMPAFFKKGNQISPDTLRETRKVASKRVHIERVIGQMKTFKILNQPMNRTETLLSSDIVFICAMLVNFRSNIINENA